MVWLAQAPVFAVLIVALFGRDIATPITMASWAAVGNGHRLHDVRPRTGGDLVRLLARRCRRSDRTVAITPHGRVTVPLNLFVPFGKRVGRARVAVVPSGCVRSLAIVYWGSELRGQRALLYFVVAMAALIGMFLGLVVTVLAPMPAITAMVLLAIFIVMAMVGGRFWPLPASVRR